MEMAPRKQPSTNRRRSLASPEVWFRIVHLSADHVNGYAEPREQTVEVTLGPDWAFEAGNLGRLTRRVPASQVVCAVPPPRHKPKPGQLSKNPTPPQKTRGSSAARFLRLAQEWHRQLDAGEIESQAAIARREGLSRARVSQIMSLLRLAPSVQRHILSTSAASPNGLAERAVRSLTYLRNQSQQTKAFKQLCQAAVPSGT